MNFGLPDLSEKRYFFLRFFSLKYSFSQITFFGKVRETNIHSKSFLKTDSAHFGKRQKDSAQIINRQKKQTAIVDSNFRLPERKTLIRTRKLYTTCQASAPV